MLIQKLFCKSFPWNLKKLKLWKNLNVSDVPTVKFEVCSWIFLWFVIAILQAYVINPWILKTPNCKIVFWDFFLFKLDIWFFHKWMQFIDFLNKVDYLLIFFIVTRVKLQHRRIWKHCNKLCIVELFFNSQQKIYLVVLYSSALLFVVIIKSLKHTRFKRIHLCNQTSIVTENHSPKKLSFS